MKLTVPELREAENSETTLKCEVCLTAYLSSLHLERSVVQILVTVKRCSRFGRFMNFLYINYVEGALSMLHFMPALEVSFRV